MKIGLICPYDIVQTRGGVPEIIIAQQAELLRRGHDTYIITPRPQDYSGDPNDHMIFIGAATNFNSPTRTSLQLSASMRETVDQMLNDEQFDVLHFHEPWIPILSLQILSRSTSVNIATFHAKLPETMLSRTMAKVITPYTKSVLKYIDAFTAVSEAAAEYVCSLSDNPITIIPNCIDLKFFRPPRRVIDNRKRKTILFVGRLDGRKGVKHLLHAFRLLQDRYPNMALTIAGNGPEREKLEMLTQTLELENVNFLGYVSQEEKIRLLQTSDLFCSPALFGESFGIVLLEAMATGLVTVAGDNPGYASVMRGLGAISLANPKHTAEFARRIDLLLHEADLRKLWRDWAAAEIPQYANENIVSLYLDIYEQALDENSSLRSA